MVAAQDSRVTVITGGGSGMGRATAVRLARRGDSVCICDLNEDGINETRRTDSLGRPYGLHRHRRRAQSGASASLDR